MSNIEAVNALLTAINFDRFAEIEARHNPDVIFNSFRGPSLRSSVDVEEWHRKFLRDYADCNYTELEYIEQGDQVAVRATIEAKGDNYRAFTQRVIEVLRYEEGGVAERKLYGMLPNVEFDKAVTASMANATGFRGGSTGATKSAIDGFYGNLLKGDAETAKTFLHEKAALIDSVYGLTTGPENIMQLTAQIPLPVFGSWRITNTLCGAKDAMVELAVDSSRPRLADWVRIVDGKIAVIETYWMFREIGIDPFADAEERYRKQVIFPK
jgi:ketosteroid isomerase-like protein